MTALLLAMAASGAWGISDFLGGLRARTVALPVVLAGSQLAGLLVLVVALSDRLANGRLVSLPLAAVGAAALAGAGGMVSLGLLYVAMSRGGTVVVAPISAGTALVAMAAGLLRGERLGPGAVVGALLALGGALVIGLAERGAWREAPRRPGPVVLAAASGSAACAGLFLVAIRAASVTDPVTATLVNRVVATGLVLAWAIGCRPDLAAVRRAGWLPLVAVAAVGVTDAAAELSFASASARAPLSVVTPLSSLYPAVAVLLGLVLLRERIRPVALLGVGSAIAGVALLGGGV
jgi:drug/metabolite transporter (DMT)-like permease